MMLHEFEESRGFSPGELDRYGIRLGSGGEIILPTVGRGNRSWYERKYRPHGQPKYETPAGVEAHLYNPEGLGPHSSEVWIAEGEFDTLSLICSGIPACGVLGAGSFKRDWQLLFQHAEIVLAFDPDEKGISSMDKLEQLWPQGQVSRFDPSPYGDLNEWFVADRAGFEKAVKEW